ncbi:MAG TPA: bifunctional 4-hydroxy-2-oxoglutarate aldolase/2-dehydro-3-deoxy-phosphogluconate aldolase [Candidatus Dormibacteraeota bacterium]|nr:bifunctional 4-hydroxy-2-oxoglutarate aldolase/2-dehydro-3-deoxy-phosphogluconate aldolase [Candidatus Dormibacteraeota bacterium]
MLTREQAFPTRVAGVIRCDDSDAAFRACVAAIEGGIGTIEVTTTVPSWPNMVRGLIGTTLGSLPVGVGTVMDPDDVPLASEAGAAFVVTPVVLPAVAEACKREDILCVLGALTPTEVRQARVAGADIVKIFPIQAVGGASYVRWVQGPLPGIPLWVSGGVEIEQIDEYLSLGVAAVGLTTALFPPDAVRSGDAAKITALARRAAAATGAVWA